MQTATKQFINRVAVALTCFIALGILLHDTKFDKAITAAFAPVIVATASLGAQAVKLRDNSRDNTLRDAASHTHVERVHLNHAFANSPRIQPRDDMRKYFSSRKMNQGNDFFGGARIIWPSV